jgi:hypothetical protein
MIEEYGNVIIRDAVQEASGFFRGKLTREETS